MYNIHVCIELAVWCYGEEAAAIVQAESDAGKASMHNAGGEELISLSGHRASVGVRGKMEQEVHATPRPEHTRSSIWWLEVNIFKCLVLDGL